MRNTSKKKKKNTKRKIFAKMPLTHSTYNIHQLYNIMIMHVINHEHNVL